ncbi:S9 family peptidase [Thermomonas haemolytica]|uniref:Oligopeptidase B n=1 Tax=Thermomonas haemolytica TaxID=141949 RepID=A0A4R3N7C2_9GAMM|nr:S9 family peptidase [Thermomonas haemolytica]TCT25191.1 oligopeptidase B [Thermomonas haemolytica]TNY30307.1 oligopeptidase B [Thermomonas haemolytica]
MPDTVLPPDAPQRPHVVTAPFGATRHDPYYWLRDDTRSDPAVLGYLQAENAYADAVLAPLAPLQETLYAEFTGRIQQDDASVPFREHGWWYYARFEAGKDYPIHARRADAPGVDAASILAANAAGDFSGEQVLLDVNALAAGHAYFSIGSYEVSPDGRLLAWTEDTSGRRQYVIRTRELDSGTLLPEAVAGVAPDLVWAADARTLLYIENDPETLLTVRVKAHVAGTDPATDALLYEEEDDSFYLGIDRSRDERFLLIHASSTVSDEVRYAPLEAPHALAVLAARERGLEYDADHHGGRWVIRTNADGATNFKLVTAADGATARSDWRDWVAHDPQVFIEGFELFADFTAIAERRGGLERLRLLHADGREESVAADEPAYSMGLDVNSEPDSDWLRYGYTSLTTPATVYEVNVRTGERRLLKRQPVPGYDPADYVTERLWASARDGTRIPVSIVYRKGFRKDGRAALLQYGYGSYGLSMDPAFSPTVVSLLDRGMAYAIAHIRGGQELGRPWYEDGKLLNKQNTFTDFIDVTDFLVREGYAAPDRVAAYGGSAGGLLMGAIANMAPEKYRVILSQVPFVDVVTTMLDPSIPLTTNEYDEWGNPEQPEYYQYMLGYSPYDNLRAQAYPAMFVGTGLWDSQVQYWEPAKYVARLRDLNQSRAPVVLRTNMDAGHGGKSGRFRRYREQAEMYAFLLEQLDVAAAG